jgi:hypothetical protein
MTRENFRTYVRSLIAEPYASYWTDPEIDAYTDVALILLLNEFWYLLKKTYKKTGYLSITSGNDIIDLPADCLKVLSIKIKDNPMQGFDYIPEDAEDYYEKNGLPGWTFEEGKIKINPVPMESKADYLKIKYLPKITFENLPDCLFPLLAVRTIIQAKIKDENVPVYIMRLEEQYKQAAMIFLNNVQTQNEEMLTE